MAETPKRNLKLARTIAEDLFTNGMGQRAQRLVLTVDSPVKADLGGWNLDAAVDRIAKLLTEPRLGPPESQP